MRSEPLRNPYDFEFTDECSRWGRYGHVITRDEEGNVSAKEHAFGVAGGPEEMERWAEAPDCEENGYEHARARNVAEMQRAWAMLQETRRSVAAGIPALKEEAAYLEEVVSVYVRWLRAKGYDVPLERAVADVTPQNKGEQHALDAYPHLDEADTMKGLYWQTYPEGTQSGEKNFRQELTRARFYEQTREKPDAQKYAEFAARVRRFREEGVRPEAR